MVAETVLVVLPNEKPVADASDVEEGAPNLKPPEDCCAAGAGVSAVVADVAGVVELVEDPKLKLGGDEEGPSKLNTIVCVYSNKIVMTVMMISRATEEECLIPQKDF